MSMSVSAVILTYKRQANLSRIVEHLSSKPYIGEIFIRDQSKMENLQCYGRYVLACQASNTTIFTMDDDCIVNNIDEIYEVYLAAPDRIAFGLHPSHYPLWEQGNFTYPEAQLAMVGWGAFFPRAWCEESTFAPYVAAYGKDQMFFRESDRIFSVLLGRQHNPVLADIEHLPGFDTADAMWKEEEHFRSRDAAIERCLRILRTK
jgi:hypothetical protein